MLQIIPVENKSTKKEFIHFPYNFYKNDPYWVAPLLMEMREMFNPNKHPFYEYGKIKLFLAKREEKTVGRIAGIINSIYHKHHDPRAGFFGFFECEDNTETAGALLKAAGDWVKEQGMSRMLGPASPSSSYDFGLLTKGFNDSPRLMTTYNPPYYQTLLESNGLKNVKLLYAYKINLKKAVENEKLTRVTQLVKDRHRIKLRPINMKKIKYEIKIIETIYRKAWQPNWGHVPFTQRELDALATNLKPMANPDFIQFAFIDDQPVGMGVAIADFNFILKQIKGKLFPFGFLKFFTQKKNINWARVLLLGVLPEYQRKGIDGVLCYELLKQGNASGIEFAEGSWILEDNEMMNRAMRNFFGEIYKEYHVYEKKLI